MFVREPRLFGDGEVGARARRRRMHVVHGRQAKGVGRGVAWGRAPRLFVSRRFPHSTPAHRHRRPGAHASPLAPHPGHPPPRAAVRRFSDLGTGLLVRCGWRYKSYINRIHAHTHHTEKAHKSIEAICTAGVARADCEHRPVDAKALCHSCGVRAWGHSPGRVPPLVRSRPRAHAAPT